MSLLKVAIIRDVFSAMPTDNTSLTEGRLFISYDTGAVYRDNGTTWDVVVAGTGGLGGGTYFEELLTFTGSTATLSHTPATFEALHEDGKKLRKVGGSPEFTQVTTAITLGYTPLVGGKYVASYWY